MYRSAGVASAPPQPHARPRTPECPIKRYRAPETISGPLEYKEGDYYLRETPVAADAISAVSRNTALRNRI